MGYRVGLNICAIIARIKKYKKYDEIAFLSNWE